LPIRHPIPVLALASVLLAACASTPDPAILMPGHPPGRAYTRDEARDTLELVAQRKSQWEARWSAAIARCHGRFLASDCESRVHAERRVVETELDRIALQARRALREHEAVERNAREAGLRPEGAAALRGLTEPAPRR
jgi:hypothetical protein